MQKRILFVFNKAVVVAINVLKNDNRKPSNVHNVHTVLTRFFKPKKIDTFKLNLELKNELINNILRYILQTGASNRRI